MNAAGRPSVFCADIVVNKITGQREKLWKNSDDRWRHAMCTGTFTTGHGDSEHTETCTCPCHK